MGSDEIRPQDMQIPRRLTRKERLEALSRGMKDASEGMRRAILGDDYEDERNQF